MSSEITMHYSSERKTIKHLVAFLIFVLLCVITTIVLLVMHFECNLSEKEKAIIFPIGICTGAISFIAAIMLLCLMIDVVSQFLHKKSSMVHKDSEFENKVKYIYCIQSTKKESFSTGEDLTSQKIDSRSKESNQVQIDDSFTTSIKGIASQCAGFFKNGLRVINRVSDEMLEKNAEVICQVFAESQNLQAQSAKAQVISINAAEAKSEEVESEKINVAEAKSEEVESEKINVRRAKSEEIESEKINIVRAKSEEIESEKINVVRAKSEEIESEKINVRRAKSEEIESEKINVRRAKSEEIFSISCQEHNISSTNNQPLGNRAICKKLHNNEEHTKFISEILKYYHVEQGLKSNDNIHEKIFKNVVLYINDILKLGRLQKRKIKEKEDDGLGKLLHLLGISEEKKRHTFINVAARLDKKYGSLRIKDPEWSIECTEFIEQLLDATHDLKDLKYYLLSSSIPIPLQGRRGLSIINRLFFYCSNYDNLCKFKKILLDAECYYKNLSDSEEVSDKSVESFTELVKNYMQRRLLEEIQEFSCIYKSGYILDSEYLSGEEGLHLRPILSFVRTLCAAFDKTILCNNDSEKIEANEACNIFIIFLGMLEIQNPAYFVCNDENSNYFCITYLYNQFCVYHLQDTRFCYSYNNFIKKLIEIASNYGFMKVVEYLNKACELKEMQKRKDKIHISSASSDEETHVNGSVSSRRSSIGTEADLVERKDKIHISSASSDEETHVNGSVRSRRSSIETEAELVERKDKIHIPSASSDEETHVDDVSRKKDPKMSIYKPANELSVKQLCKPVNEERPVKKLVNPQKHCHQLINHRNPCNHLDEVNKSVGFMDNLKKKLNQMIGSNNHNDILPYKSNVDNASNKFVDNKLNKFHQPDNDTSFDNFLMPELKDVVDYDSEEEIDTSKEDNSANVSEKLSINHPLNKASIMNVGNYGRENFLQANKR